MCGSSARNVNLQFVYYMVDATCFSRLALFVTLRKKGKYFVVATIIINTNWNWLLHAAHRPKRPGTTLLNIHNVHHALYMENNCLHVNSFVRYCTHTTKSKPFSGTYCKQQQQNAASRAQHNPYSTWNSHAPHTIYILYTLIYGRTTKKTQCWRTSERKKGSYEHRTNTRPQHPCTLHTNWQQKHTEREYTKRN